MYFGMRIDGLQINPREWWDEHWIKDRIMSKLAPGQAATESASAVQPATTAATHRASRRRRTR